MRKVGVLVVGLGNMGLSHARAYAANPGFEIVGLCSRGIDTRRDMALHVEEAINSLRIVLAADESMRTGRVIDL